MNTVIAAGNSLSCSIALSQPERPVLIRLVRMTFHSEALAAFRRVFDASAPLISAFEGCLHVELWQDAHYPNVLTTFSLWETEEALERYRKSVLFKETWRKTKPLFAAPPEARSHHVLQRVDRAEAPASRAPL